MESQTDSGPTKSKGIKKHIDWLTRIMRIEVFIVLVGSALLIAAVAAFMGTSNNDQLSETNIVNSSKFQAVFLNNGQVYFGKIVAVNDEFYVMNDIFYLETQDNAQKNNNFNLRKLGVSELHAPEDRMVINRDQVTFWENLKDTSLVVRKIHEYEQNPGAAANQTPSGTGQSPTSTTGQ